MSNPANPDDFHDAHCSRSAREVLARYQAPAAAIEQVEAIEALLKGRGWELLDGDEDIALLTFRYPPSYSVDADCDENYCNETSIDIVDVLVDPQNGSHLESGSVSVALVGWCFDERRHDGWRIPARVLPDYLAAVEAHRAHDDDPIPQWQQPVRSGRRYES